MLREIRRAEALLTQPVGAMRMREESPLRRPPQPSGLRSYLPGFATVQFPFLISFPHCALEGQPRLGSGASDSTSLKGSGQRNELEFLCTEVLSTALC